MTSSSSATSTTFVPILTAIEFQIEHHSAEVRPCLPASRHFFGTIDVSIIPDDHDLDAGRVTRLIQRIDSIRA